MNSRDCIMVSDKKKYWCLHFKGSLEVATWIAQMAILKIALIHLAKFK